MPIEPGNAETLAAAGTSGHEPLANTVATEVPAPAAIDETLPSGIGQKPNYSGLTSVDPDHYVDRIEITRGGMGRILAARDRRLKRKIAIKELRTQSAELRARFEREALLTARLQHPSIVSIYEAGRWPSGEPFFAMKLVPGRPLDQVVAGSTSFDTRLALLPHVLAVADALAYAHQERVIHRDLKPQNVLVGKFGETVVIDWGIAKDLADTAPESEVAAEPSTVADVATTEVGDVLGTPAYMPPEQADGQAVDERADVYAIGALLYHVLSGVPPYTEKTSFDILEAVKRVAPVPLGERQPGVPPDLLAIVSRAMARPPADRYPTARELAEDLRRFQTGQLVGAHRYSLRQLVRRWLRRHRAAVSVAGVAMAVLVVLGTFALQRIIHAQHLAEEERAVAVQQRAFADASRVDAEDLLGFMLGDLRKKLEPLGKLDILDAVANRAGTIVARYDRRDENHGNAGLAQLATARRTLGDVRSAQHHTDEAVAEYRAALAINEMLAVTDPTNADRQRDLSAAHESVGNALLTQGDTEGALGAYRTALAIRETRVATDPTSADRQRELEATRSQVGDALLAQGDATGALATYRAALATAETLAANESTNDDSQRELAIIRDKVGDAILAQGNAASALTAYREALAIRATLSAKDPKNALWQDDLYYSHSKVGVQLQAQGDTAAALVDLRAAVVIAETLAARDPMNADRQREVSASRTRVGDVLRAQGNTADALAIYRAALGISDILAAKDPTNAVVQRDLSIGYNAVGDLLLAQGDAAGALAEFKKGLPVAEKLAEKDPTRVEGQLDRSASHERVGDALLALGDAAGAVAEYRACLTIDEKLAARNPTNADAQAAPAYSNEKVGDALLAERDAVGALATYRSSLTIREAIVAKDPTNADRQRELAQTHEKVGDALSAGDKAGALAEYKVGLAIAKRLVAKDPANADWSKEAASLAAKVARCCGATETKRPR